MLFRSPDDGGTLTCQIFDGEGWHDGGPIGPGCHGRLALATGEEQLLLVYETAKHTLACLSFDDKNGWSGQPQSLLDSRCGAFAVTAVPHTNTFMLVWSDAGGNLYSRRCTDNQWDSQPTLVGHKTDGYVALAALGASLFLICKAPGTNQMNVISYNTADFNVTTLQTSKWSGPYDDAVKDQWSPSAFPVAHYAYGPNPRSPDEDEPRLRPYRAGDRIAAATLDGVIHLAHTSLNEPRIFTETFSISGVLTPKLPISYRKSDTKETSNGYGTLAQAGWSEQMLLEGVYNETGDPMVMCRFGEEIVLIYGGRENGHFRICQGGYG